MISKKVMMEEVTKLNIAFSLNKQLDELKAYCAMLYGDLSDETVSDQEFIAAMKKFRKNTTGNMYNKFPSPGDIIDILGLAPKHVEKIAKEQCELVFSNLNKMNRLRTCMFGDRVTNYVLKTYSGGLRQMAWDFSNANPEKKEETWGRKDFIDRYITSYDLGKHSVDGHKLSGVIGYKTFGDEEQCNQNAIECKQKVKQLEARKDMPKVGSKMKGLI